MNNMYINDKGLELIKSFESLQLKSYKCPANVLTIGYGHTGKDVKVNMTITESQADELLNKDIENFIIELKPYIKVELNDNQFSAIVSLVFNIGIGNFSKSTLLKKLNLNPNIKSIKDEFLKWVYAGGKISKGLIRRRESEANLYFTE